MRCRFLVRLIVVASAQTSNAVLINEIYVNVVCSRSAPAPLPPSPQLHAAAICKTKKKLSDKQAQQHGQRLNFAAQSPLQISSSRLGLLGRFAMHVQPDISAFLSGIVEKQVGPLRVLYRRLVSIQ
jgi:hypothetical protein